MSEGGPSKVLMLGGASAAADAEAVASALRELELRPHSAIGLTSPASLPEGPYRLFFWIGVEGAVGELARSLAASHPQVPVVGVGAGSAPGATHWFRRPPSATVLRALIDELSPRAEPSPPPSQPQQGSRWRRKGDMIIGHSLATQELLRVLDRLAPSVAPVMVTGESGTGKELVARALHYSGPRASAPFIAINCAAVPESLFEAELFGHEKGAFTGAQTQRLGAFESAHNGTLFLDEIGEMPLVHQAKLLRVLETSEVTRLGTSTVKVVNVRVVAATNRDLAAEVKNGRFREDLYYRLRVYPVHLEPLRNRSEDIPPIVHHHLALIAARDKRPPMRLMPGALERILSYRWPGNVRELVNTLERACLVAHGEAIEAGDLSLPEGTVKGVAAADGGALAPYRDAKQQFDIEYYRRVLQAAGGNISRVAKLAQKTRKEVYDALKRLGLDAEEFRGGDPSVATPGAPADPQRAAER